MIFNDSMRLFIFDFDGTVADTETLHWEAYNRLLAVHDIVLDHAAINRYIGNNEISIIRMIKEDYGIEFDGDLFTRNRLSTYLSLVKESQLKPYTYFEDLMTAYPDTVFVILSSQKLEIIEAVLDMWCLGSRFEKIISVSEGDRSKEDIISDTMQHYGFSSEESVLFEDTNKNLKLGKTYGLRTVGIQHGFNNGLLEDCDWIIDTKDGMIL